jgi:hypothetical protein
MSEKSQVMGTRCAHLGPATNVTEKRTSPIINTWLHLRSSRSLVQAPMRWGKNWRRADTNSYWKLSSRIQRREVSQIPGRTLQTTSWLHLVDSLYMESTDSLVNHTRNWQKEKSVRVDKHDTRARQVHPSLEIWSLLQRATKECLQGKTMCWK